MFRDNPTTTVHSGESVQLRCEWRDHDGNLDTPTAVYYQVFDKRSNAPVSPLINVPSPAATMAFIVSGAYLRHEGFIEGPAGTTRRFLTGYVIAEFGSAADRDYLLFDIYVMPVRTGVLA